LERILSMSRNADLSDDNTTVPSVSVFNTAFPSGLTVEFCDSLVIINAPVVEVTGSLQMKQNNDNYNRP
ncbi:MAG: hypothetical protein RAM36_03150, partial [Arsenophonus sp.]|nr:hypothetical protein [Arsenophonus sp.]